MSNTTRPGAVPSEEASSPAQQSPSSPAETPAGTPASSPAAPTSAAEQRTSNPPASPTQNPPTQETSQAATPPENTPSTPAEQPSSPAATSQPAEQPTSAAPAPTSAAEPPTSANDPSPSDESTQVLTTIVTVTPSDGTSPQTSIVLVTSTIVSNPNQPASTISSSASSTATPIESSGGSGTGLSQKSKVAIGVVVPIAAIAILAIVGLFLWKKRRARQAAQEERRKEVEDYSYNPNADPTIPNVGMGAAGSYEMREDGSSGYRGWGTTTLGSTGRKASTTMSGGVGQAYSDATSPTMRGNMSDAPLMDGSYSPEGEILGAMGPSAANNRGADVHRGPSNASSSYSAAARSENSDGVGMTYGAGGTYYDQYAQNNPYNENAFNQQPPSQPIIRDNPARRNTRIESPSHYPQQSAGISQNF